MARDKKWRETLARVDDKERRRKVCLARDIIYEQHFAVNNDSVNTLLKGQSLAPTLVRDGPIAFRTRLIWLAECILKTA